MTSSHKNPLQWALTSQLDTKLATVDLKPREQHVQLHRGQQAGKGGFEFLLYVRLLYIIIK